ncbi:hypothetical protein CBR_g41316 [Chara braunii]|uniref:Protein kinase domain-containing protein n=1 Tax=Chara braunii TaxID=69332 RepID=A0A388LVT6_CHABU|nr:hypothetical protein CBR_g41316 [Chara braunii]|eukprot:GBG86322.1 hypothetical protein CBR_g41316 [Chara braunii]
MRNARREGIGADWGVLSGERFTRSEKCERVTVSLIVAYKRTERGAERRREHECGGGGSFNEEREEVGEKEGEVDGGAGTRLVEVAEADFGRKIGEEGKRAGAGLTAAGRRRSGEGEEVVGLGGRQGRAAWRVGNAEVEGANWKERWKEKGTPIRAAEGGVRGVGGGGGGGGGEEEAVIEEGKRGLRTGGRRRGKGGEGLGIDWGFIRTYHGRSKHGCLVMFDARIARLLASVIFIWGFQWGVSIGEAGRSVGGGGGKLGSAAFSSAAGRWSADREKQEEGDFSSLLFFRTRPGFLSPPFPSRPPPPPPPSPFPAQPLHRQQQSEHSRGSSFAADPPSWSRSSSVLLVVVDRASTWLFSWVGGYGGERWTNGEVEDKKGETAEKRRGSRRSTASNISSERAAKTTTSWRRKDNSRFDGMNIRSNSSSSSSCGSYSTASRNDDEDAEEEEEEEEEEGGRFPMQQLVHDAETGAAAGVTYRRRRRLQLAAPPTEEPPPTLPSANCSDLIPQNLTVLLVCHSDPINASTCCPLLERLQNASRGGCEHELSTKLREQSFNESAMLSACSVSSAASPAAPSAALPSAAASSSLPNATGGRGDHGSDGGGGSGTSPTRSSPFQPSPSTTVPPKRPASEEDENSQKNPPRPSPPEAVTTGGFKKDLPIVLLACALGVAMLVVLLLLFCLRRRIGRGCRVLLCMGKVSEKTGERGLNRGSSSALRSEASRDASTPAKPDGSGAGGRKGERNILNRAPEPYTVCKFSLETLSRATRGFNPDCVIGEPGGFGRVYRGTLDDGRAVAIKMMKGDLSESKYSQFLAEVELQSRLHHTHLCELIGYCDAEESWLLVYPFIPGGTLFEHLHGRPGPMGHRAEKLDWPTRVRIALHVSKAIRYLHEEIDPPVLHRDVKSANILLDQNKRAKLADFGLAKLGQSILVDTERGGVEPRRLCGTYGYMAPEYMVWGKLTARNDVYAFGVVLLEIVTGRRAVVRGEEGTLATWVRPYLDNVNDFKSIVDPILLKWGVDDLEEIYSLGCLAGECTHGTERLRPAMSSVVERINKIAINYPVR